MARLHVLILLFFAAPAMAGAGTDRMNAFLNGLTALKSNFTQLVFDESLTELERSGGEMYLERPGRFRWNYTTPYVQQIVADGQKVWIYDSDLEQVIVKTMDSAMSATPALLLSSSRPVEADFEVSEINLDPNFAWVELKPKSTESNFINIRLGFDTETLRQMELLDNFGQLTQLSFSDVDRNPRLDAEIFKFVPPAGADVVGQ